ncbi:hypothetical protein CEXT_171661 [Caerostris extrusa]|uniref:Uncharacterized protein n=1 Tax=Caerostris extrusa TaxID=172846 RepID=A0AAV4QYY3_CAEEX|nr:hypothetical protein CEXT_171661 [Caerostris extrusa]
MSGARHGAGVTITGWSHEAGVTITGWSWYTSRKNSLSSTLIISVNREQIEYSCPDTTLGGRRESIFRGSPRGGHI